MKSPEQIYFAAAALVLFSAAANAIEPKPAARAAATELNAAEKLVLAQTASGEVVDLRSQPEAERKLDANFVVRLLTGEGPAKVHRNGIQIVGAIIVGPIDSENAQIPYPVSLTACHFLNAVDFMRSNFVGPVSFIESTFSEGANFNDVKFGGDVFLNKTIFAGAVDFAATQIGSSDKPGSLDARDAQFQSKDRPATFNNMKVSRGALFDNASFAGAADFASMDIKDDFSAEGVHFESSDQAIAFDHITVGHVAIFIKAEFHGPVDFADGDIGNTFYANEARFLNPKTRVTFTALKAKHSVTFANAVFEGSANFEIMEVGTNFAADSVQFKNPESEAAFYGLKVGQSVTFANATFAGAMKFAAVEVGADFVADQLRCLNPNKEVEFYSSKIGKIATFVGSVFAGPVNFSGANIGYNLVMDDAAFNGEKAQASFYGLEVRQNGFFQRAVFRGWADFGSTTFNGTLHMEEAKFQNRDSTVSFNAMKADAVRLDKSQFNGPVDFSYINSGSAFVANGARFDGWVSFYQAKVGGPAQLMDVQFADATNFSFSDFSSIYLSGSTFAGALDLQGMSYKYISAAEDEVNSRARLLELVKQASYSADVYGNLEQFFSRQGYRADADRVFVYGKHRERAERLHGLHWVGSWLLNLLVAYGRHPWQTSIPCVLLVVLGCFLFSPDKMELQKKEDAGRIYNRVWYSLGLFLPFVDLQMDRLWRPKSSHWLLRNYVRVHILLGWILIPVVIASLTGLIK